MLRQEDIIVFEEIGLISSVLYSVPDTEMKHIMNNDFKMGGNMVIGNGDPFQLQAINVKSMWLSTHFLLQHDVTLLEHYVRSRSDPKLQDLLATLRKIDFTNQDVDKARALICDNCNSIRK